jgi:hypothetical protein
MFGTVMGPHRIVRGRDAYLKKVQVRLRGSSNAVDLLLAVAVQAVSATVGGRLTGAKIPKRILIRHAEMW